jgi:hypothetical protein
MEFLVAMRRKCLLSTVASTLLPLVGESLQIVSENNGLGGVAN